MFDICSILFPLVYLPFLMFEIKLVLFIFVILLNFSSAVNSVHFVYCSNWINFYYNIIWTLIRVNNVVLIKLRSLIHIASNEFNAVCSFIDNVKKTRYMKISTTAAQFHLIVQHVLEPEPTLCEEKLNWLHNQHFPSYKVLGLLIIEVFCGT